MNSVVNHLPTRPLCYLIILILGLSSQTSKALETIVVCPTSMRLAFQAWIDQRRADGMSIAVIDSQAESAKLAESIQSRATNQTRYVLLVGDAPPIGRPCDVALQVPTHYRETTVTQKWGSTPTLATDAPYGWLVRNGEGSWIPSASVGRLPAGTPMELKQLIERIHAYESSRDFRSWRQDLQLTAGIGGFGILADTAIETVTKAIITGMLPGDTRTSVAYASPNHRFWPRGQSFRDSVIERYRQGSRFWVYAGHGWIDQLDRVPPSQEGKPVLDLSSVPRLSRPADGSSIALMLACYTGAFDAPQTCLAEQMVLHKGGPIAAIAGSRVTMPYGNTTFTVGLIDGIYQDRCERLGDALLSSVKQMTRPTDQENASTARKLIDGLANLISPAGTNIEDERHEHALLYNLIGDPTLKLHPPERIDVGVEQGHLERQPLRVVVTSPINGTLEISIELPLGAARPEDFPDAKETLPGHWQVASQTLQVRADQPLSITFDSPGGFTLGPQPATASIRARVAGSDRWASGAVSVVFAGTTD